MLRPRSVRRYGIVIFLSVCLAFSLFGFLYFNTGDNPAQLPPLPGTYRYFTIKNFHSHIHRLGAVSQCDSRFALDRPLSQNEIQRTLDALLKSYTATMQRLKVETWMAHEALLGLHWNHRLLPWDTSIGVQMPFYDLERLAKNNNMSEFEHSPSTTDDSRKYILDVNPHYSLVSLADAANKIDARWIDTTNGKYIDITAVHRKDGDGGLQLIPSLFCKDGHIYKVNDIYPLSSSTLEGVAVKVPAKSDKILEEEYGAKALSKTSFHWHKFNPASQVWEPE